MLGFLETLTLNPGQLTPADITPLREQDITTEGIKEAIYVCYAFSVMDRLADAFGFQLPPKALQKVMPQLIDRIGYGAIEK